MRTLCFILMLVSCLSAAQTKELTKLSFKKDLIPEGIAIDAISKKIYLNSLHNNKIVRCNFDGSNTEDFISVNQYGYLPGFGMTIKGDTLFALGNSLARPDNSSILLLLNINSGKLIKSYSPNNSNFIYLNDIAIGPNGKCYITDSENENIYTINSKKDALEVFFSHPEINHSNGIAISPDGNLLYLATYTSGLRILDINSKKLVNAPNDFKGIDGMKFYKNSLLTIINARRNADQNGLFQFYLNKSNSKIIKQEKLDSFQNATDIPTTFALYNDQMFFVSDSQLDNLNQETNEILNPLELKDYILIKQPINSKPFKNQNP
ncbi:MULTISPECIES: SMP-30/gluconolactonase/LRE family protein [Flavobacteriaceae]|uniref:SMP-30/gluconolactonase/LRE family protein n=1 Tax=Flavobacteriaceae TaxID=49546 RepID=UPI0014916631|nr:MULTISPECIES: SMP-30/gluconolactonase/LRE family protein [Allomuricauda]MDC6366353.1 SMP-30/gluconolactonase/LRE family protein [Muricauda sp. AC10]